MTKSDRPTMRRKEAAEYLGCHVQTISRRISEGAIQAKRMGGKVLVYKWSLDAYLDSLPDARGVRS